MYQLPVENPEILNILDSAGMGIWRFTFEDGKKPRMAGSPKLLDLIGLDPTKHYPEEEIYDNWFKGVTPQAVESVNRSVAKMISGTKDENTYEWLHPTKGIRMVRCGGIAYKKGNIQIVEGYHYDVTETTKEERKNQQVISALANTYRCLFYLDLQANYYTSYVYDVPEKYNIPESGNISKSLEYFINYAVDPKYRKEMGAFVDMSTINERLRNIDTISQEFIGMSGKWTEASFIVCDKLENGDIHHMVMAVKDISTQKAIEAKRLLELKTNIDANKSKTIMLQNMTHEIRTPLNAMFGFSQILSLPEKYVSDKEREEYFIYIYNSFNMLSMLINDVLDMADAEHGNYRIQMTDFAVNPICRTAIQMVESRKPAAVNLYFTSEVDDDYTIHSDSRRIQQVLINFLTNACKHTQEGEIHVHLSTTENEGRLTFSVTDTGEGIPEDKAKMIFKRYKKIGQTSDGHGIGLHICNMIAQKMGAELKLDTTYKGGARFLFIL